MDEFSKKHADDVHCVLSVFDRVLIKGYLPISSAGGMESFMSSEGVLIKDFGRLSSGYADVLKEHARRSAERSGRPYVYLENGRARKEDRAREIAVRDDVRSGLVCVFSVLEPCASFRVAYEEKRPEIRSAPWKCCQAARDPEAFS